MYIFFYVLIGVLYSVFLYFFYTTEIRRYIYLKKHTISGTATVTKVVIDPNSDNYDVLATLSFTTEDGQLIEEEYYTSFSTPMKKGHNIGPEEFHQQNPTMPILYNPNAPHLFMVAEDISEIKRKIQKVTISLILALIIMFIYITVLLNYILK